MALYQLTLFYPSLKKYQATIRSLKDEIQAISGNNFRVLSAGEQVCAIGFVSDAKHKHLEACFLPYKGEHFEFLLTQVSAVPAGYLSQDVWQWLHSHLTD